jgi:hypothetical protein
MDDFLKKLRQNTNSTVTQLSKNVGDFFSNTQRGISQGISSLVRGSQKNIFEPIGKLMPEQYDVEIEGPSGQKFRAFKNLYVETAAQALGLGGRDTDVLERLPSATIGAFKGAADGLAQSLTFGWWNPEIKYANDIEEQAGKMTEVEFNIIGTVGTFLVGGGLVAGALKGVPLLARVATVAPKTFSLLSNGLTFAGLTQVQKDEAQKDAGQRAKDFVSDFALGGAFSIAGMKPSFFKSSAIIGPATYVTSLLKGDSNEDALKSTAAMMGLHSMNFALAKYLPNGGNLQKQLEKAAGEQLNITKQEAFKYLGVEEKATVEQIKQAWKNKVVDITKSFPAQAMQTPQQMAQFNQAWNTANRAYEFIAKISNPSGYTGKSFRKEFQDLYYELWQSVPDKRAMIVKAVRNMPAGLSIRATLEDTQRNEIVKALGGENAKTRLGRVAELTDADLVAVAMEKNIKVTPSKPTEAGASAQLAPEKEIPESMSQTEILKSMRSGTGEFKPGELYTQKGQPQANKIVISGRDKEGNILGDYIHSGLLSPAKFKPEELEPLKADEKAIDFVLSQFGISKSQAAPTAAELTNKFSPADQKAAKAEEIRMKYRPEEQELLDAERVESVGEIMQSANFKDRIAKRVNAPNTPRTDELKDAPSGQPPRPPEETSLSDSTPPPDGSALSAIDAMVGKKSAVRNVGEMLTGAIKSFPRLFTDRFAAIRKFENDVSKLQGQPIDINSSPYVAARMYAVRFGIVEGSFRDLQKIIEPVRKLRPDFTRFVLAQRAIERAERGFKNPAGVTLETAEQALAELQAKVGEKAYQQFEQAGQNIQDWSINAILKPMRDTGILGKEAFEAITEKNKHWMPFHVLEYLPSPEQADKMMVGSETFSVSKQGVVKALEGTEKIIRDPFESILDNLTKAVSLIKRNEVARKVIDLRNAHPEVKEFIKFLPGDQRPPEGWDSISVFINGKATRWAVPNELSEAMHAMTPPEANLLGKMILLSSKAFKAGTTTLYFPFTLSNAIRDYQTATMVAKWGFNPANWLSGFGDGLKGAFKWESKAYDDFMRNQGGYGGYIQSAKGLSIASKELFAPKWMQKTKAVLNPFELISNFSEAIELAPRLGIYKKGLGKEEVTPLEAAFEARNVTVDFAKAGIEGRLINMWIPFVNARWQGLLNVGRVMKDHPLRTAARAMVMTVLPGVATYFYNVMNHEELWDDIPQWAKDTYFIIIVGEEQDEEGNTVPKVVQIPKGDIGAIFFNPIMYALEYVRKQEPQNLFALGLEWTSQLSPVPFTRDGELSAQAFLGGALPPALKTPIEIATNTNFFTGFPVVPRKLEKVAPTEQYDERTPDLAVTIGRALGVSPMKLTHALYGLTGSFSKELLNPADILGMTAQRFYRASGGEKQRIAWDLKYDTEVGYNTTRLQIQKAMQQGDMQQAQELAEEWNIKAGQIVPTIIPLLMKDDPKEAASFQKSVTFSGEDIQRLLKLNPPTQSSEQPKGSQLRDVKNLLRGGQSPAGGAPAQPTVGQIFPGGQSENTDVRSLIRQ